MKVLAFRPRLPSRAEIASWAILAGPSGESDPQLGIP